MEKQLLVLAIIWGILFGLNSLADAETATFAVDFENVGAKRLSTEMSVNQTTDPSDETREVKIVFRNPIKKIPCKLKSGLMTDRLGITTANSKFEWSF
jgi:hypothetical protein